MDHPGPHLIRDPCSPCHPWSLVFESTGETPVFLSGTQAGWNPCTTIRRYTRNTPCGPRPVCGSLSLRTLRALRICHVKTPAELAKIISSGDV